MADNFKAIIEVAYQLDQANKKLQSDIKKTQEQYKIKFKAEIDDKTATTSIKNIQNYQDNFNKKNLSAIDMEIKKKQESASLFSKQIQSQMQERISAENKIQSELQKTAKLSQDALNFKSNKIQLDNNISTYLNENTKLSTGLKNRLAEIQSQIKNVDATGLKNLKQSFREVTSEAKSLDQTGNSAFTKLGKNVSQFLSFMGAATITMTAINTVRNMIDEVKNLDDQLLELSKVSDLTAEGLSKVTEQAFELGRVVGKTGTQVLAAITSFQSAGYELSDSLDLAEQALVMTNIAEGIDDASVSAKGLIAIMKGYKNDSTDFARKINDSINQVSNTQAIDFDNLVEGARTLSAVANQSQVSYEQMLGILTGGYEVLGDMSKVANGAITIFSRLQAIQLEGEESVSTVAKLQDTFSNATKGVVNIVDETTGQLRGAYDILDDLSGIWDSLDKNTQSALATEAAGVRQKNTFLSIVSNWGAVEESVKSASDSFGSASEENQKYLDSISGRISQFQSEFQKMSSLTVDSDLIKMVVDFGTSTLKATNAVGGLVPVLITVGVVAGVTKVAMNALLLSTEKQTIANLVAATSQVGLAGAIQLTGSAIKSFMLTNPIGWILALGTAVFGVVKIYDALTTSLEEQKEKLEQANTAYESSKTELESINSELQTTAKRIDELNSKDNLTFVEQGELDELKKVTEELLIQQDIMEKQKAYNSKQLASEALNTFNKQFGKSDISQNQVNSYVSNADLSGNNALLTSDSNNISSMIAAYKQLEKLKQEAFGLGDNESVIRYKEALDDVSNSLYGNITDLTNWKSTLESIPLEDLTDAQKQALTDINNAIELIYQNIDPTKWKEIKFDSLISSTDTKETVNELKELAKAGELTPEVLNSTKEYAYLLELTGLTAEEVSVQINAMANSTEESSAKTEKAAESMYSLAKAAEEATGYVNDLGENVDISKLQGSVENALSSIKDFNSILKSMDTNKGLTSDDLDTITQKYPQLLSYIGDEKELREQLTKSIEDQKESAKGYYKDILELDTNLYNDIMSNNATKVNTLNEYYGTDLSNYKSLAKAKNEVETTLLTSLNEKWAKYYSAQSAASEIASHTQSSPLNSGVWGAAGGKDLMSATAKMAQEQADVLKDKAKTEQVMYNQMKNLFVDTDYTGINVDSILLGTDKSSSGTKDKFSQLFNWIPIAAKKASEKAKSIIDSISDSTSYKSKNKKIELAIGAKLDEKGSLDTIKKSYEKLAGQVGLSKEYRDLVDNGALKVETITDEKLANKIDEYTKWRDAAKEVGEEIGEISDTIKELNQQKLDNIKSYFDMKNGYTDSKISKRESLISLKEAQGGTASKGDYSYLIKLQNDIITNNKKEREAYELLFNDQVKKGIIKKGSVEYYEGLSYLNELTISAREAQSSLIDLSNEKIKLTFKPFDTKMEKSNKVISEVDQATGFVDDNSIEQIALFQTGYAQATQNVKDLNAEIKKLNKQYAGNTNDPIYKERLADLESQLSSNASAMQSYEQSIISSMKARYDKQINLSDKALKEELKNIEKVKKAQLDSLKKQLDEFKKYIDTRKKELRDDQKTGEFEDSVAQYNKDISKLESRIGILKKAELQDDNVAREERISATEELDKLKKELDKFQKDRSVDLAEDALDAEYDAYEEKMNKQISDAESFYDLQTSQAQSLHDNKVLQLESLYENERQLIIEAAQLTQDKFTEAFASINSTMGNYGLGVSSGLSTASGTGKTYANSTAKSSSASSILGTQSEANKYQQDTSDLSGLNKYLASKGYGIVSKEQMVKLAQSLGLSDINSTKLVGTDEIGRANKSKILEALKKSGFSKGGYVDASMIKSTDEDGLALVKHGEPILTVEQGKLFKELVSNLQPLNNLVKLNSPDLTKFTTNNSSPIVNINLPSNTTISKDAINDYRKLKSEITEEISKSFIMGSKR